MSEIGRVAVYAAPGSPVERANTPADIGGALGVSTDRMGATLLDRAEAWIGRAVDGRPIPSEAPAGWTREQVDRITVDARRYGFHGTLKAPFSLAPGLRLSDLQEAVGELAAARSAVLIPALALTRLGGFFALTPGSRADPSPLHSLADDVVTELDAFRAPLTEAERARRRPERLPERQRRMLETWGYPYVLDDFQFHLTVTDRIATDQQDEVEAALRDWFADCLGHDIRVDALAVFVEPEPGAPFALRSMHPLAEASERLTAAAHTRPTPADPIRTREDAR